MTQTTDDSSDDLQNEQIYARVCALIKNPDYLQVILAQYAPGLYTDADLAIVAEAVLSDDDQAVDRYLY